MASRAQITRLAQRIEELAESAATRPRKVVRITQEEGETEDEAVNKYFGRYPEDVGSDIILSVYI